MHLVGADPRVIMDAARSGMLIVERNGRISYANKATYEMFGYTGGELAGLLVEELVPAALRDRHLAYRAEYSARPVARPMGPELSLYAVRKDGSLFPVEIGLTPVSWDGQAAVVATVIDISNRDRVAMYVALQEKHMALKAAADAAAHDISGPLSTIVGLAAACLGVSSKEERIENLQQIKRIAEGLMDKLAQWPGL